MGKASSNKKVARAAKAGGSRARAAGERNLLFPVALVAVMVLGILLVFYTRDNRQATAQEAPTVTDHWHSAYGIDVCGDFQPNLPEFESPQNGGTHTHGDGLIHIHPFSPARAGANATLENFFQDAASQLGNDGGIQDDSLSVPGGKTYTEGKDTCDGIDGDPIVQVAIWKSYTDAVAGNDPDQVVTKDFSKIRFEENGEAFTVAFLPEGADIPPPDSASKVEAATGVPDSSAPADTSSTVPGSTDTSTDSSTSSTSAPASSDSSTTTTEAVAGK